MNPMMNYQGQGQGQGQGQQDQSGGSGQQGNPIQNPMMMNPMFFGHQMMMNQQMMMNPMMMNPMMMNSMMNSMIMNPMINPMMNSMMNPMINTNPIPNQQQTNPNMYSTMNQIPQQITQPPLNSTVVQQEYQPLNRQASIILAQPAISVPTVTIQEQSTINYAAAPAAPATPATDAPATPILEQQLINQFVNVSLNTKSKKKATSDVNFKQWRDGRNIIKLIHPVNINEAHFNSKTHPNEKYSVEFINGNKGELIAFDINEYTLYSQKIVYEHNTTINQSRIQIKGTSSIYTRTSSPNGISHKTQLDECLKYAKDQGFTLTGYYCDDGVSGRKGHNLKHGELGFWTNYFVNSSNLLIYSVDRLTRHLLSGITYIDTLVTRTIDIHFVTNKIVYNSGINAMHKSMIQQELQTAEKYSNDTSEKIKGTLRRLREEGHCVGGRIPYGVKRIVIDGIRKQVSNPSEIDNIKIIKTKFYDIWKNFSKYSDLITHKSNFKIINYLITWCEEQHIKHRNNTKFTINQIKKIIITKK